MVALTFPDGARRDYPPNITGLEVAKGISPSLAHSDRAWRASRLPALPGDRALQRRVDAGLPARTACPEMVEHVG